MRLQSTVISILFLALVSCDLFIPREEEKQGTVIATAMNQKLYLEDIKGIIPPGLSEQDSLSLVQNYMNRWATTALLIDRAKANLPPDELKTIESLARQYETDLYSEAYKEAVINKKIDTTVTDQEVTTYYATHQEDFRLNEELVMYRFLQLDESQKDYRKLRDALRRFNEQDQDVLKTEVLPSMKKQLNDSIWYRIPDVVDAISPLTMENAAQYLKQGTFTSVTDSTGTYAIYTTQKKMVGDVAPLAFLNTTLRRIIINSRKQELIKELERDILEDAIRTKDVQFNK